MYINKNKINPELHLPTKIPFHVKESTVNSPAVDMVDRPSLVEVWCWRNRVQQKKEKPRSGGGSWLDERWLSFDSPKNMCVFFVTLVVVVVVVIYIYIFFVVVSIHFPTERDFNLNCHKQQHGVQFRFYHSVGASLWFFMLQGRILKFHFCHQLGTVQWGCIPVCSILHFYDYCRTMESLPDLFGKLWPDCRPLSLVMWFDKWNQLLKKSPYFGLVTFFSYCLPRSWVGWI